MTHGGSRVKHDRLRGSEMETQGNEAQQPSKERAEYVPVWLKQKDWETVKEYLTLFDPSLPPVPSDVEFTIAEAIEWAEGR